MTCYNPIVACQPADGSPLVFARNRVDGRDIVVACGQCHGCRLRRARDWAIRCMHEASLHSENCFITLTYDPKKKDIWSLEYEDFQVFIRGLRDKYKRKVRYYVAGEYGEAFGRPHFHAILFGFDFPDKRFHKMSPAGFKLYRSDALERLWSYGFSSIGNVTMESAGYCARYVMKKMTGDLAETWYEFVDVSTGEVSRRVPEFNRMSLKPGIGARWLEKFEKDVYPEGMVVVDGVKTLPPRYYDKKFKESGDAGRMEYSRHLMSVRNFADNTVERLKVKELVSKAACKSLKRTIE